MPRRNEKDLVDLPEDILEKVNILLVDRIEEALEITLDDSPTSVPS
jgi:ATP-dependent Lon protease